MRSGFQQNAIPQCKLVRPFLVLSSFIYLFKGKKLFFRKGKIFEGGNYVDEGAKNFGGQRLLAGIAWKKCGSQKKIKKCEGN